MLFHISDHECPHQSFMKHRSIFPRADIRNVESEVHHAVFERIYSYYAHVEVSFSYDRV